MTEKYSYRRYQSGDALAINELYYAVTGIQRTLAQFKWQWLSAPEGEGEIWLIETTNEAGQTKLIGHHGIMPIAFTDKKMDLLFGKTENTMVLPEFRRKILYPRFEKKFSKAYSDRFDALFSTMGPKDAIRQRIAQGYEFPTVWVHKKYRTSFVSELFFIFFAFKSKFKKMGSHERPYGSNLKKYKSLLKVGFMSDEAASLSHFFVNFWSSAKLNYNIAPRREQKDLNWRFWSNPYKSHLTLVVDEKDIKGYVIVSFQPGSENSVFLEDFSTSKNSDKDNVQFFQHLLNKLREVGIRWITVNQSLDSSLFKNIKELQKYELRLWNYIYRFFLEGKNAPMTPRKITDKGREKGLVIELWDATALLFEGRI